MVAMLAAEPCVANSEPVLSANFALVSDYRYRGISLSDRDPAVQGGFDLEGEHFFAGAWASSIADYGEANTELDLYAGLVGGSDSLAWSAGAYAYLYPGAQGGDYVELIARADKAFGFVTIGVETAFVPLQGNVEGSNIYLGASGTVEPAQGFTFLARGGYEDGFYDRKWDWELGLAYQAGPLAVSVSYVDTNYAGHEDMRQLADGSLVASLGAEF